jgi:hypothetical protein
MDQARLKELVDEATAFSYDEEEAFWGLFSALMSNLPLPLQARAQGEPVTIARFDGSQSGLPHGIAARILKGGQETTIALSECEIVNPDQVTEEWLAAYDYWMKNH